MTLEDCHCLDACNQYSALVVEQPKIVVLKMPDKICFVTGVLHDPCEEERGREGLLVPQLLL